MEGERGMDRRKGRGEGRRSGRGGGGVGGKERWEEEGWRVGEK